jgi:uncharacterized OsmC-like protein
MSTEATDELRAVQEPLKQRYREEPEAALVTLEADGSLDEGVACSVNTGRALVKAGLHPATGGDGSLACSGDMLLQALVACAGVTMQAVATSLGMAVSGSVRAEGDLDFRGTLSVDRDTPVGFQAIRLSFQLQSDADEEQLATLLRLTERYCVVFQTLAGSPQLSASHSISS